MTKLWKRHSTHITLLAMSLAFVVLLVVNVGATGSGIDGKSQTGCTPCHAATADPETTVSITGLPDQFTPGDTYPLTITVTSTTVPGSNGGFDLSVTAGTLSTTDPNVQIVDSEAIHKNNNARSWQVSWTAPTDVGSVIFYVAGQATNGAGTAGDAWNLQQYSLSATGVEGDGLPNADFTYTSTGLTLQFTDQSSDPDGEVSSWSWDFGDGFSSSLKNPNHTFSEMGTYNVVLTVTDDQGNSGVASKNIMVPSAEDRMQLWITQVAIITMAIVFVSFIAVGIARKIEAKKEGEKHGGHT